MGMGIGSRSLRPLWSERSRTSLGSVRRIGCAVGKGVKQRESALGAKSSSKKEGIEGQGVLTDRRDDPDGSWKRD